MKTHARLVAVCMVIMICLGLSGCNNPEATDVFSSLNDKYSTSVTITFDTDGGNDIDPVKGEPGAEYDIPDDPVKDDHIFAGWEPELPDVIPDEDLTVVALWNEIADHTIIFDTGDESDLYSITQKTGTAVTVPDDPVREGFTFNGWVPSVPDVMPDEDLTIVAQWTADLHTITFDTDGGSTIGIKTFRYGDAVEMPSDPVKTGYTFSGWTVVSPSDTDVIPDIMPAYDIVLKADWDINEHTITFDTDGGSSVSPITAVYGSSVTAPSDPVKKGYTFVQWSPVVPSTMPDKDVTIKAVWSADSYVLTFDAVNGSCSTRSLQFSAGGALSSLPDAKASGNYRYYTFDGWYTKKNGQGTKITSDSVLYADTAVYANYVLKVPAVMSNYHLVTFYALPRKSSGNYVYRYMAVKDNTPISKINITVPDREPVDESYGFNFWQDAYGLPQDEDSVIYEDTELYPVFMKQSTVKVTLDYAGGTYKYNNTSPTSVVMTVGKSIAYGLSTVGLDTDVPVRDGYAFTGWSLNGKTYSYSDLGSVCPELAVTLKATWKSVDYNVVLMDPSGSTTYATLTRLKTDRIGDISSDSVPNSGHVSHWVYLNGNYAGAKVDPTSLMSEISSGTVVKVYPVYATVKVTINTGIGTSFYTDVGSKYQLDNGYSTFKTYLVPAGTTVGEIYDHTGMTKSAFIKQYLTKNGKSIVRWTDVYGNKISDSSTILDGMFLYADYGDLDTLPTYDSVLYTTVNFKVTSDVKKAVVSADVNRQLTLAQAFGRTIQTPVRPGYTFAGWFLDEGLTAPVYVDTSIGSLGQTVDLWPKWIKNTSASSVKSAGFVLDDDTDDIAVAVDASDGSDISVSALQDDTNEAGDAADDIVVVESVTDDDDISVSVDVDADESGIVPLDEDDIVVITPKDVGKLSSFDDLVSTGAIDDIVVSGEEDDTLNLMTISDSNVHRIAFNANYGSCRSVSSMYVTDGFVFDEVREPFIIRHGYEFFGWQNNTTKMMAYLTVYPVKSDLALKATWSVFNPANYVDVSYLNTMYSDKVENTTYIDDDFLLNYRRLGWNPSSTVNLQDIQYYLQTEYGLYLTDYEDMFEFAVSHGLNDGNVPAYDRQYNMVYSIGISYFQDRNVVNTREYFQCLKCGAWSYGEIEHQMHGLNTGHDNYDHGYAGITTQAYGSYHAFNVIVYDHNNQRSVKTVYVCDDCLTETSSRQQMLNHINTVLH